VSGIKRLVNIQKTRPILIGFAIAAVLIFFGLGAASFTNVLSIVYYDAAFGILLIALIIFTTVIGIR
jgi:hypothetical protein